MKRSYIVPQLKVTELHLEKMIAASIGIGDKEVDVDDAFSTEGDYEDDWSE